MHRYRGSKKIMLYRNAVYKPLLGNSFDPLMWKRFCGVEIIFIAIKSDHFDTQEVARADAWAGPCGRTSSEGACEKIAVGNQPRARMATVDDKM